MLNQQVISSIAHPNTYTIYFKIFVGDVTCCGCLEPRIDTGCDDKDCESLVCAQDSFCCENYWDFICANISLTICPVDGATS